LRELIAAVRHQLNRPDNAAAPPPVRPISVAAIDPQQPPTESVQVNVEVELKPHPKIRKQMAWDHRFLNVAAVAVAIVVVFVALYRTGRLAQPPPVGSPADSAAVSGTTSPVTASSQVTSSPSVDGTTASVIEFAWPGADCWDIFRGDQLVTYGCGAAKQALQAGSYTIKGKHGPVFMPFEVTVKAGSTTRIEMGGLFGFNWPGADCWDIFRGDQFVIHGCGAGKQALQAGTYTIKGKHAPVFAPFEIVVADGGQVKGP